ncbi:hypothetical protein C7M84_000794 [Penaeus vannamei]|uniref:Uncharacterized protein n=1 Tax=Penaeus vannamei TaxID=6689 RepID=A0A423TVK1_PENVA|nr:hypothetical protein C7M84_000794 [Penaeus vannamei]
MIPSHPRSPGASPFQVPPHPSPPCGPGQTGGPDNKGATFFGLKSSPLLPGTAQSHGRRAGRGRALLRFIIDLLCLFSLPCPSLLSLSPILTILDTSSLPSPLSLLYPASQLYRSPVRFPSLSLYPSINLTLLSPFLVLFVSRLSFSPLPSLSLSLPFLHLSFSLPFLPSLFLSPSFPPPPPLSPSVRYTVLPFPSIQFSSSRSSSLFLLISLESSPLPVSSYGNLPNQYCSTHIFLFVSFLFLPSFRSLLKIGCNLSSPRFCRHLPHPRLQNLRDEGRNRPSSEDKSLSPSSFLPFPSSFLIILVFVFSSLSPPFSSSPSCSVLRSPSLPPSLPFPFFLSSSTYAPSFLSLPPLSLFLLPSSSSSARSFLLSLSPFFLLPLAVNPRSRETANFKVTSQATGREACTSR